MENHVHGRRVMTPEAFAVLGGGKIAYLRPISSEEVRELFPQAPELAPGLKLFALLNADGTPILLTDSREAALANALQNELTTVSVHCRASTDGRGPRPGPQRRSRGLRASAAAFRCLGGGAEPGLGANPGQAAFEASGWVSTA